MTTPEDVQKLAALARISLSPDELPKFTEEFDAIIAYVGQLDSLSLPPDLKSEKSALRNVLREDGEPTLPQTWTEKLASAFPERDPGKYPAGCEGDALVVKQIIQND